ncbi:MAG TPA: AI-2E family transporter, partial [Desulfobacterales bacterium]|nr:AI-2E family transporter [Desulfobacterales bacterium]
MNLVADWFRRTFSDPRVVALILALVAGFTVILFFGNMLAPVLASLVIAYLLEGVVGILEHYHLPRLLAVIVVFVAFMLFVVLIIFGVLPLASSQLTE